MTAILLVLTSIALIDSTSMVPTSIVPILVMLGGRRPVLTALMFVAGILIAYLGFGLLLVFGLTAIIDQAAEWAKRWLTAPNIIEIWLQIIIGAVMVVFAVKVADKKEEKRGKEPPKELSPWGAWTFGAVFTLGGIWGSLPYFAAIDEILRADLSAVDGVIALLYYNAIFVAPLIVVVAVRVIAGERSEAFFTKLNLFFSRWTKRLVIVILLLLGLVLVADGVGLLIGKPVLPLPAI